MTIVRNLHLLLPLLSSFPSAANTLSGGNEDPTDSDFVIFHQGFFPFEGLENMNHSHLRRKLLLRDELVCLTNVPVGQVEGNCESREQYSCTCRGTLSSRTMCEFCPGFDTEKHKDLCLQVGSSTTYFDKKDSITKTCVCDYDPNTNTIQQDCHVQEAPADDGSVPEVPDRGDLPGGGGIIVIPPAGDPIACLPDQINAYSFPICLDHLMAPGYTCDDYGEICSQAAKYACTCDVLGSTMCPYCQLRTPEGIVCQRTGSWMEFVPPGSTERVRCSCVAYSNGGAQTVCEPVVDDNRSDGDGGDGNAPPIVDVPPVVEPSPPVVEPSPPVVEPSPEIPSPPVPSQPDGCRTTSPLSSVTGNCDSRADYACTCSGGVLTDRTMCSFCPGFDTARHNDLCLQTGSSTTFFDRTDRTTKTCSCDYNPVSGQIQQDCHVQEPPDTPIDDAEYFQMDVGLP